MEKQTQINVGKKIPKVRDNAGSRRKLKKKKSTI